jgi:hypothetical protein
MSDFVLWTALLSPFLLGAVVIGFELWRMHKAPAEYHEHCSAVDDDLTRLAHAYNSRHGKTFPRARGAHSGREGLLQPSATPDQQSDT